MVARICRHQDECVGRRPGEAAHVAHGVAGDVEEVEGSVPEVVVRAKTADPRGELVGGDLDELAAAKVALEEVASRVLGVWGKLRGGHAWSDDQRR